MSNKIIPMLTPHRAGKSPLDEFLPETVLAPDVRPEHRDGSSNATVLSPNDVQLDPVEHLRQSLVTTKPSTVQLWPMLAAGLVAGGATLLAVAIFSKYSALGL